MIELLSKSRLEAKMHDRVIVRLILDQRPRWLDRIIVELIPDQRPERLDRVYY